MITILGLILAALVLVFFEIILPGGLLGILAFALVVGATALGFSEYGVMGGISIFLAALISITVLIFVQFKYMATSRLGKGFFLSHAVSGHSNKMLADPSINGKAGVAVTRLNPSGKVAIDEETYEAYSQDGYIESGDAVVVVSQDSFKLIIRKL